MAESEKKTKVSRKIKRLVEDFLNTGHSPSFVDIARFMNKLYNALLEYYETVHASPLPEEFHQEYLKNLRKELEEKLKALDKKYIQLEIEGISKEGAKPVKTKIYVNARLFLELLTEKFGATLWDYVALRMPPPELILLLLQMIELLYARLSKVEMGMKYILEWITSVEPILNDITKQMESLAELYQKLKEDLQFIQANVKKEEKEK